MLCAFTARPIIELRARDKSKIESILAYGDRVFVGLNTGALRVYRLNELPPLAASSKPTNGIAVPASPAQLSSSAPSKTTDDARPSSSQKAVKPTELLRESEKFSTRAVEQLAIIKEANIIVSLSNYAVSLHDLQNLEPVQAPLAGTKNASLFAVTSNVVEDAASGIPEMISRLAVAVKRRLLLWTWHESELREEVTEIVLGEAIRSLTWASASKIVCGMNAGFVLVDVETKEVEDIVGQGAIGGQGAGQGSRFGAVSSAGMGYMGLGGYIPKPLAAKLANKQMLLAKDINTLFITDDGKALDKRQIPWQSAPENIGYSYPYIVALQPPAKGSVEVRSPDTLSLLQSISLPGAAQLHCPPPTVSLAHAGKGFHISSERVVWKMEATDYDAQVQELLSSSKFDEAISLLGMLEDALLKDKVGTLREVKMQKAEMLFRQKQWRKSLDLFNEDDVDAPPQRVLRLYPKFIAGDLSNHVEGKSHDKGKSEEENGHGADDEDGEATTKTNGEKLGSDAGSTIEAASPSKGTGFARLLLGHRKAASDTSSIMSGKVESSADARTKDGEPLQLSDKDLMAAVSALNGYLVGARTRLQRVLDPATGKLKPRPARNGDTDEAFNSILRTFKTESDEELEKQLKDLFRIVDTALFRAYMFSVPTLTSSLFRIPNYCDPDVVNETLLEADRYNELVDFFFGKKLHKQALELLKRFGEPDKPDAKAPNMHGPQRTVAYLQNLPPELVDLTLQFSRWTLRADPELGMEVFLADTENAETLPRDKVVKMLSDVDSALEQQYLEHVIWELNDMTPSFHTRLLELYVKHLKEKARGEEWDGVLEKLLRILRESGQYSLTKAFGMIPKDG
jgi:Vam6/Vps39-like protein vacuolar protein sorting-associated protein 39